MHKTESRTGLSLPQAGHGKRGETGYVGYLLRQAANAYETHLARALYDLDVTPPQFSVITMVAAYPGLSNADIARLSFLTPQTVGVIVGNLIKANIVSRHPHAVHGRIQQLELTDSGRRLLTKAKERVSAVESELMHGVGADDAQTLKRWFADVAERFSHS